jgi:hypothetical protein
MAHSVAASRNKDQSDVRLGKHFPVPGKVFDKRASKGKQHDIRIHILHIAHAFRGRAARNIPNAQKIAPVIFGLLQSHVSF